MAFDDAMAMVGTYLTNNELNNSENNDRFFYIILNELRQEYAPTVEMTQEHKDELLMMRDNQEPLVEILAYLDGGVLRNDFDRYWEPLTEKQLIQAWLHPETIRVVDE